MAAGLAGNLATSLLVALAAAGAPPVVAAHAHVDCVGAVAATGAASAPVLWELEVRLVSSWPFGALRVHEERIAVHDATFEHHRVLLPLNVIGLGEGRVALYADGALVAQDTCG